MKTFPTIQGWICKEVKCKECEKLILSYHSFLTNSVTIIGHKEVRCWGEILNNRTLKRRNICAATKEVCPTRRFSVSRSEINYVRKECCTSFFFFFIILMFTYVSELNGKDHKSYLVLREDRDDTDQFLHWRQRKLAALTTLLFVQNLGRALRRCSAYL